MLNSSYYGNKYKHNIKLSTKDKMQSNANTRHLHYTV